MKEADQNIVIVKTKAFALRIIKLFDYLCESKREYVLSKQLLRAGTSIGTNVKEAVRGQSKADFGAKMNIALKEASETEYRIELLGESGKLTQEEFASIPRDCQELLRILTSIVKTTFAN